jgi:formiminotetrahydrofolate cyclodeaminase
MYNGTNTIDEFLMAAAAKQPAPGGGSVTALVGALAASMGEMVLNYSVGKKSLAAHEPELRSSLAEFTRLRAMMLQLMTEDQLAYEAITALRKLPEDSAERKEKYAATLLACIRVPEAMAAAGVVALELCDRLVEKANVYLLSDLAVCAELAMATMRCGIYNVRINLTDVSDAADVASFRKTIDSILVHGTDLVRQVVPRIWNRIENP